MEEILIEEFNYPLPDERIAKYPLANRDQSKLLVYRDGQVGEDQFFHIENTWLLVHSLYIITRA
jgi:S-adenosylmethionine:tRNA ribosyltransferase-isomerase